MRDASLKIQHNGTLTPQTAVTGIDWTLIHTRVERQNDSQTRPVNPKQSKGTQASGKTFKYAVGQAKNITAALRPLLAMGTDPYARQRLTGMLHKAFHFPQGFEEHYTLFNADMENLIGFEFNSMSPLQDCLPIVLPFEITDTGTVKLRPIVIAPLSQKEIAVPYIGAQLAVMVVGFLPGEANVVITDTFGFELEQHLPTEIALESQQFPDGTRIIIAAQLLLWNNRTVLGDKNYGNSKLFNPVGVVWTGVV